MNHAYSTPIFYKMNIFTYCYFSLFKSYLSNKYSLLLTMRKYYSLIIFNIYFYLLFIQYLNGKVY